ncbi:High-affinity branched-chain amino acid transport ATP-binding protein LivG [Bosea sp. 62]|uniref:ABC transporter ATP-binding protein n=1 Tax=unclassified Bosea (in: a-proteobacteria) TaxID=2653178 RepID=UPI001258AF5C|nr:MULTISPECIES: ABC transporter ATP-binding protein [unclassified Bosea (in: a-proteobacteria)]CAD5260829.1 High-affinity branched-chain amino acid transport ATP-binding protein LivG [Bosea sp. 46]CAD5265376.1 High-affinity branched-chain amino acid transport ATP-binding protein LivG [Bosea sp. 21B]CAD5274970.1 High-affinity branched-chain amino acid transport ATP-binding protein LivG [Bosea sp. 7B]VVT59203.1 High-affinity branched-chain amino acid transport ATP-binding protein LivG [Bosea sp.
MTAALTTTALSVRFGAFQAVRDVSLSIRAGARHALIGPNGAGKTTLVHALTGSVKPAAGRILIAGEDATGQSEAQRVHMGLARTFQINQLFRKLTVLDNVLLAVLERNRRTAVFWRSVRSDRAALDEARSCLAFVNLLALAERPVAALPYGSQRLLEIAIALAARPRVLVLDEPAAGVPAAESAAIFERIHALPASLTVVFIEHDMGLVFRFAERITVLVAGQILTEGTSAEISADPRVREVYLGRRGDHAA